MPSESLWRRYRRFWGADPARDVDEELAFHIQMRVDELRRTGMSESEAREATMKRFGDLTDVREECETLSQERVRIKRRADQRDALRQDLRFALRTFAANRGFTLIAALTMAIGIGANTAVFSVAYGVLLRPLPFRDADALVRLWSMNASRNLEFFSVSPADFKDWQRAVPAFSGMAAFDRQRDATLVRPGAESAPEAVETAAVMPEIFPLLGTGAFRGRTLMADDAQPGAPPAVVVSYDLWSARFGEDAGLVGRQLTLDGKPVTVVGIMPRRFWVPGTPAQIWTPLSLAGASDDHSNRYLRVLARLAPGRTLAQARPEADAISARLARDFPATNAPWTINMMGVPEMVVGRQFRRALLVLVGVVAFVLLIAGANTANLQLARAAARQREIALRAALGATRGRITRQLLTESLALAGIAAGGGLLLAVGGIKLLRKLGETTVPRLDEVRIDAPALAFTALVALGSGVLFGLLPALRASRSDAGEALKEGGRTSTGAAGQGVRSALVVAEVSLSLVLLVGAGLLMRSFVRLQAVELGFDARGVLVAPLRLSEAAYPDSASVLRFYGTVIDHVRRLPGVASVAAVNSAPFAGVNPGLVYTVPDRPTPPGERPPDADYRVVTPGYLRTMGIRLLSGRDFTEQDTDRAPSVVLVSETTAGRTWPAENAIGRQIRIGDPVKGPVFTVVGVVADARYQSLETPDVRPMMYFSALARPQQGMMIVVRGANTGAMATGVREAIAAVDPRIPTPTMRAMDDLLGLVTSTRRFALGLFAVFAATALLLAAVGIYGVMSYLVRQRMHELGIRLALGAPARVLLMSVVGRALRLTMIGVGVGLAGAWGLTRVLAALLFEVGATDRPTFAAVAVLLVIVAGVASLVPAYRATRADPLLVLRGVG